MIDRQQLLKDLQRELPKIEADILAYSELKPELSAHLQAEYDKAQEAGRTADHFVAWREAQITQAAVAWILTCVFVRFLEDNGLLDEPVLSGPAETAQGKKPLQHAKERMIAYFNQHPTHAEREYLLSLFEELETFPVIAELLDHKHNPLWQIPVSADGAKYLIDFFQKIDVQTGELVHDFTDEHWDTRFLGDLYQDLSESVRKKYALLQTPEFVESFILDYTLEKAKETFGLEGLRLIDPTCGSGHFLLTTFERCFDDWLKREPATNSRELAQRALNVVHGIDINPYAIAICRFRLLIAAMKASGTKKVKDAPNFSFNLACGDSLLHGKRFESSSGVQSSFIEDDEINHAFETEDKAVLDKILGQQYHAVVGNPPYITVKDAALREAYRAKYQTCHRKYSLGVPFTERFFDLTLHNSEGKPAGFVGMITANSFMKREFGKKLIEFFLKDKDLTHIIDTSGALLPGHGTPTMILFAHNQGPHSPVVRSLLGIKGEPSTPEDFSQGKVWQSVLKLIEKPGAENDYISSVDIDRKVFASHPWSLEGGGSSDAMQLIENAKAIAVSSVVDAVGPGSILGENDAFGVPRAREKVTNLPLPYKTLIEGEGVRNWFSASDTTVVFPYNADILPDASNEIIRYLWPLREGLYQRKAFSGLNYRESGREFYEYQQIPVKRNKSKFLIAFPFVSTHNHFALDRGGKVFNRTAPVIKLPNGANEADHFVLLGLLNSSITCFWGRQTFFPKGGFSEGKWEERLEWDGTKLKRFPIPKPIVTVEDDSRLLPSYTEVEGYASQIDSLAQALGKILPESVLSDATAETLASVFETAEQQANQIRAKMVVLQEELDWHCYQIYGLIDNPLVYQGDLPLVKAGERAFEIQLAKDLADKGGSDAWFTRHDLVKTTTIPAHWPDDYKALIKKRLVLMQSNRFIKLIEKPEFKRRWFPLDWAKQEKTALKNWLLNYLETQSFDASQPSLTTCAILGDKLHQDLLAETIAARYTDNALFDAQALAVSLVAEDHVPQFAAGRLKPAAMKKFRAWQETWTKQRQEDVIDEALGVDHPLSELDKQDSAKSTAYQNALAEAKIKKAKEVGVIPLPPKYAKSDMRQAHFWSLRGKLDVPKERFFSLPGCEKDGDTTLVIGWAGMNHLQRAQAIAAWYIDRKESDGWGAQKLMPMLVALDELIPWLKQWHNDIDPEFGERMGNYYEGFLLEELRFLDVTKEDLLHWEPPMATRARKKTKKAVAIG